MKNRLPASGASAKKAKPPRGRHVRVYLSPKFLAWCQRNSLKAAGVAPAMLHTHALENPGTQRITVVSSRPGADKRIFFTKEDR